MRRFVATILLLLSSLSAVAGTGNLVRSTESTRSGRKNPRGSGFQPRFNTTRGWKPLPRGRSKAKQLLETASSQNSVGTVEEAGSKVTPAQTHPPRRPS